VADASPIRSRIVPLSRSAAAVLGSLALPLVVSTAYGAPSVQLRYVREPGTEQCPEEVAIRGEVERRLGYAPFTPTSGRAFVVTIQQEADRLTGRIELVDGDGMARGLRVVSTDVDRCDELISTLALAISIAIDPVSVDTSTTPAAPVDTEPNRPEAPVSPPVVEPTLDTTQGRPVDALRTMPALRGTVVPAAPIVHWSLGVGSFGSWGIQPSLAAGGLLQVMGRRGRVSLALDARADLPSHDAKWGFRAHTLVSSLAGCLHNGPAFGCLVGVPGVFFASGDRRGSAFFLLVGTRLGAEVPISEQFGLQAAADALIPAVRPRVIADADRTWVGSSVSVSLGGSAVFHFR
jgi:hypothetical protein